VGGLWANGGPGLSLDLKLALGNALVHGECLSSGGIRGRASQIALSRGNHLASGIRSGLNEAIVEISPDRLSGSYSDRLRSIIIPLVLLY